MIREDGKVELLIKQFIKKFKVLPKEYKEKIRLQQKMSKAL